MEEKEGGLGYPQSIFNMRIFFSYVGWACRVDEDYHFFEREARRHERDLKKIKDVY